MDPRVSFFEMGTTRLSLFPRAELARDAGVPDQGSGFAGFTLAHDLGSIEAVDALFAELRAAGVKIIKQPHRAEWGGYSGYFADSEGLAPRHGARMQRGGCGRGASSRLPHPLLRSHRVGAKWEVAWNPQFPHA